jgi:hypothetical protein
MGWVSLISQSSASVRPIWRSSGPTLHIHNITHVSMPTIFLKSTYAVSQRVGTSDEKKNFFSVLWIRIRKFFGLQAPDLSLFVGIQNRIFQSSSKKSKKTLISTVL